MPGRRGVGLNAALSRSRRERRVPLARSPPAVPGRLSASGRTRLRISGVIGRAEPLDGPVQRHQPVAEPGEHLRQGGGRRLAFHHVPLEGARESLVLLAGDRPVGIGAQPFPHRGCVLGQAGRSLRMRRIAQQLAQPFVRGLVQEGAGIGAAEQRDDTPAAIVESDLAARLLKQRQSAGPEQQRRRSSVTSKLWTGWRSRAIVSPIIVLRSSASRSYSASARSKSAFFSGPAGAVQPPHQRPFVRGPAHPS